MLKRIPNFENYAIDEFGNVWSYKNNKYLKPKTRKKDSYLQVTLCKNGKMSYKLVHRLVAETFIGEIPQGYVIDHIDTNRQNNHVSNLRIVTPKENANNPISLENLSKAMKGNQNTKGKKLSEEHKEKIRKSMIGQKRSEETKAKMSKVHSKPIIIDDVKYKSATEASKVLNINRRTICGRLNSPNFTNYNYK